MLEAKSAANPHENVCSRSWRIPTSPSKHWIIRQYDHEVQGGTVIKPLIGPQQIGPSDAAVIRPKLDSIKGVVVWLRLAPHIEDP